MFLRFRQHRVTITADVSKMYRAIELAPSDRDFHRFMPLLGYRMTRVTFGVSSSPFVLANMSLKRNALEHESSFPTAY